MCTPRIRTQDIYSKPGNISVGTVTFFLLSNSGPEVNRNERLLNQAFSRPLPTGLVMMHPLPEPNQQAERIEISEYETSAIE